MKNLGYKSKNILAILLIVCLTMLIDFAIGQVFFSAAGGALAAAPAFINLEKGSGVCNMAGIATTAYVIPIDDIESFPAIADPADTPSKLVTYINDFTLKGGKKWYTLYSTKEMGELLSELDGPTDGKFFRNKATLFHPRTTPDALGMMTLFKDTDVVVIVKEFGGGGQMRVIGTKDLPATIAGSENSGKGFADEKGITYTIEAASCKPAMIYTGTVQLAASPYTYTETDENLAPSQYVSGYDGITGWDKTTQTQLWFNVYDNAGAITLRAYTTQLDRDAATNEIFSVVAGGNTVVEANLSGYGGTLDVATGIAANEEFNVVVS